MEAVRKAIEQIRRGEKEVDLLGRKIGNEGATVIGKELEKNSALTELLDLGCNSIGAEGCAALASALQSPHSSVIVLVLGENRIGSEGCALLASALESPHSSLSALDLYSNSIGDEGCAALASALQSPHSKLTTLILGDNRIGDEGCAALASALQSPHSKLNLLDLEANTIGDTGASLLANALEKNTSLRHINMRENVRISTPVKARILGLVQLSRDGVTNVRRDLVAKLPDELLQQVTFYASDEETTVGERTLTWSFERIADFAPILSALRELVASTPSSLPQQPSPRNVLP